MVDINDFIRDFSILFPIYKSVIPWEITSNLKCIFEEIIPDLGDDYVIVNSVAIHKTAVVETGAIIKAPSIIGENSFVGANAYFREGVFIDANVKIGAGCEVKSSIICSGTAIAHFNYVGNSIIGHNVNFEAGSVAANHYNERANKNISVLYNGKIIGTGATKFGSLVGDGCRIGANAVLSPGTLLMKSTIVKRLELIEQVR
ncbi:LpxA family transferase [Flavobacterium rivuli WB 3.3-2 = DSM 21788]|uniref:LpxA family transferase n=1 Tax=Flavobacterium rivuli WB 3.3-2 = DSM 21788 TaxID=1121895 RepID=A0A0A2LYL3_9FLAO|nr:DapH/DapD/GlmU-related protein [Flavobacterium rivuli]KGO85099.1 LpxA family transferase [Flavobacterium rivuli WB 3.3-2 = DSM 21788]